MRLPPRDPSSVDHVELRRPEFGPRELFCKQCMGVEALKDESLWDFAREITKFVEEHADCPPGGRAVWD